MENLIVFGAGGHAKSVLEVLFESGQPFEISGILDPEYKEIGELFGIPLLGDFGLAQELYKKGIYNAFIANGSNTARKKLAESLLDFKFPSLISRHAKVGNTVSLGEGSIVMPGACLRVGVSVGRHCIINTNACVDHESIIGDYVHVAPGCAVSGKAYLGDGVFLGTGVSVIDRVRVGEWSTVGAGSTVVKDLPSYVIAVGSPVKINSTI